MSVLVATAANLVFQVCIDDPEILDPEAVLPLDHVCTHGHIRTQVRTMTIATRCGRKKLNSVQIVFTAISNKVYALIRCQMHVQA